MKIYQPGKDLHPKVLAIFPLFPGLVALAHGYDGNLYALGAGIFLTAIAVWTFFGRSERYIDLVQQRVVTRKKWLCFSWGHALPLSHYKHVSVVYGPTHTHSRTVRYNVVLVGKDTRSNHSGGLNTNMYLATFHPESGGKEKALEFASQTAQKLSMPVYSELL